MICSESWNLSQGGPMMPTAAPKNASETLCVGRRSSSFPVLKILVFGA